MMNANQRLMQGGRECLGCIPSDAKASADTWPSGECDTIYILNLEFGFAQGAFYCARLQSTMSGEPSHN